MALFAVKHKILKEKWLKATGTCVNQTKRALSDKEASIYIGMSESWLRHNRITGPREGRIPAPKFIKINRTVRYLKEDLDEWLEQFQRKTHLS